MTNAEIPGGTNSQMHILENKRPNAEKVFEEFRIWRDASSARLRVILDQALASFAKRNGIVYERVTVEPGLWQKIKNFLTAETHED